jgi:hypothetical protein
MPYLGAPYATDASTLGQRMQLARDRLWVDCGFLGLVASETLETVCELVKAGAFGLVLNYGAPQFYGVSPLSAVDVGRLLQLLAGQNADLPILAYCDLTPKVQLDLRSPYLIVIKGVGAECCLRGND